MSQRGHRRKTRKEKNQTCISSDRKVVRTAGSPIAEVSLLTMTLTCPAFLLHLASSPLLPELTAEDSATPTRTQPSTILICWYLPCTNGLSPQRTERLWVALHYSRRPDRIKKTETKAFVNRSARMACGEAVPAYVCVWGGRTCAQFLCRGQRTIIRGQTFDGDEARLRCPRLCYRHCACVYLYVCRRTWLRKHTWAL